MASVVVASRRWRVARGLIGRAQVVRAGEEVFIADPVTQWPKSGVKQTLGRDDLKYAPLPLPIVSPKYFPVRGRVDGVVGVDAACCGAVASWVVGCGAVLSWAAAAARPRQARAKLFQVPCLRGYVRKGSSRREMAQTFRGQ